MAYNLCYSLDYIDRLTSIGTQGAPITLHTFGEESGSGHPRVCFFPHNTPEKRWRVHLLGLTLDYNSDVTPYGWGYELEEAYLDYVRKIKGRHVQIIGKQYNVPTNMVFV